MSEQRSTQISDSTRMSDRYAAMAAKSAGEAQAAVNRAELAAGAEEPRDAKRARREAKEWAEQATRDAMRAHGALSAELGQFEAIHQGADEAMKRAIACRDQAADIYRDLKKGDAD
jgi:hypothetical protein